MDIIWIILAIIAVGYFIVRAINRSTATQALIANEQYLNSPEYLKQRQASMDYFDHLNSVLDHQIWIAYAMNRGDKERIKELKQDLRELDQRYEEAKKQYIGYQPETLEVIKDKYGLAIPFSPSEDGKFINEYLASSWSMYLEKKQELQQLNEGRASAHGSTTHKIRTHHTSV